MKKDIRTCRDYPDEIPYSFDQSKGLVKWIKADVDRFTEPFFHTTIQQWRWSNRKITCTGVESLVNFQAENFIKPTLFIFHVSRCGSTLLSQMMAQLPQNIVLSEPMIVDELLKSDLHDQMKRMALTRSLEILGRKRSGIEENLIVKTDCWHLLYLDLIRELFPDTPIVFVIRDPTAILNSHKKMRGRQMVPGLLNIQIVNEPVPAYDLDGYAAKVLERLFTIMLERRNEASLLLDYTELPEVLSRVIGIAEMKFNETEKSQMLARADFYSKNVFQAKPEFSPASPIDGVDMTRLDRLYSDLLLSRK